MNETIIMYGGLGAAVLCVAGLIWTVKKFPERSRRKLKEIMEER